MRRLLAIALLLTGAALPAQAHFVWIVPAEATNRAQVVFSDELAPDDNVPVSKIAGTQLFLRRADGDLALKLTEGKDAYLLEVPASGPVVVGGVCDYGVLKKGEAPPFLLRYYARAAVGPGLAPPLAEPWDRLALDVVLVKGNPRAARVLWQGKPLPEAEVTLFVPGQQKRVKRQTDKEGIVELPAPAGTGPYGVLAHHVEQKAGELGGKKYEQVKHYATLVFRAPGKATRPAGSGAKADPGATKLLADARAARAIWEDFPGFSADLEVNHNGKVSHAKVEVSATGKVKFDMADGELKKWAQGQLSSLVDHRLSSAAERGTPCAYADEVADHPLGRAIRVLNDELHSSYRIRERQIIEVNRAMRDFRFTITVLENHVTPEKKFLPTSYVVNSWDAGTGALRNSVAHHNTWVRVGKYDLPSVVTVVTARPAAAPATADARGAVRAAPEGGLDARTLRFSNHKLLR